MVRHTEISAPQFQDPESQDSKRVAEQRSLHDFEGWAEGKGLQWEGNPHPEDALRDLPDARDALNEQLDTDRKFAEIVGSGVFKLPFDNF